MRPTKEDFGRSVDVSRETMDRLEAYADLLIKWNPKINLVSPGTLPDLWTRHFADSAQLAEIVSSPGQLWADLGSGGGFPGAVVAILLLETHPETRFTLVESDQRKAAFLRTVARETGAGFSVIAERVETIAPLGAGTLSARALAPLEALLTMTERHLAPGGLAIFPKGAHHESEVEAARKKWSFSLETLPSRTDPEAAVLKIGDIARV